MYWYGQSTMCLDHFVWEHINVSWAAQVNYIQIPISRFTVSFLCFFFNPPFFDGKDHHVLVKSQVQRAGFFRLTSRLWHRSRIADWKSRIVFFSKNGQSTSHIWGKTSMLWVFEGSTTNFHYFFLTTAEVCSKFHFSGPIRKTNICPILRCPLTATQGRVRLGCTRDTRVNWRKAEGLALAHFIWV